jgi:hypothetical protein
MVTLTHHDLSPPSPILASLYFVNAYAVVQVEDRNKISLIQNRGKRGT